MREERSVFDQEVKTRTKPMASHCPQMKLNTEIQQLRSQSGDVLIIKDGEISDRMKVKRFLLSKSRVNFSCMKMWRDSFYKNGKKTSCFSDEDIEKIMTVRNNYIKRKNQMIENQMLRSLKDCVKGKKMIDRR